MKTRLWIALVAGTLLAGQAFGAGLTIPELSLTTVGGMDEVGGEDKFVLSTRVTLEMLIEGGAKFAALFKLGFRTPSVESYFNASELPLIWPDAPEPADLASALEKLDAASGIGLRSAAVTMGKFMELPLDFSFFVGHFDVFASGDEFPALFGTDTFSTKLRGFMYFPDGIGGDKRRWYHGVHEAFGTGIRLVATDLPVRPYLYFYQDSWLGPGTYSADARLLYNSRNVKMEVFGGVSFPLGSAGAYRGGLLFYFDTGSIGSFYAQIGIPYWETPEPIGIDSLYFMFEPRIRFGVGELTLSLFFHPSYYLQQATGESGAIDLRFDLMFGKITTGGRQGGLEARISYDPNLSSEPLKFVLAPYLQSLAHGVRWDVKLNAEILPWPEAWYGIFSPSVGITTSY